MKFKMPEFLHLVLRPIVKLYLKLKFNVKIGTNELKGTSGPFFLIGHHVTAFDAVFAGAYSPRMIRFIAGDANYDNKLKKFLLNLVGVIPFSKNTSDIKSVMQLRKTAKEGYPVSLFPEGGRNWDGSTDELIPSTAKLIRLLKLPVYTIFFEGGYMSKPRWGQYFRKGKLTLQIKMLLTADQVKAMNVEDIELVMTEGLSYNEYEWQHKNMIPFKGKNLAEHIERLVYKCPNCNDYDTFESHGNDFYCNACNVSYSINMYGFIEGCEQFDNLVDWYKWQAPYIEELSQSDFSFENRELSVDLIHKETKEHDEKLYTVILNKDFLIFKNGDTIKQVPIKDVKGISVSFLDVFECFIGEYKCRLTFDPKKHTSIKLFYDMIRYLKKN